MQLTVEEKLAYEFAHKWRDKDYRPGLQDINWQRFAKIISHNRMSFLATQIFQRANISIPEDASKIIIPIAERYKRAASKLGDALTTYLKSSESHGVENIVLKGLWLCEKVYNHPAMRPGSDIDILVPHHQVSASLEVLKAQGVGAYWPNLLHDDYFTHHHLHQQRSTQDLNIWFEIHWALDHPYTLLTVDYEDIFKRAVTAKLFGAPIQEVSTPDLLLSLAIHLVKHAVYLPSLVDRDDLPRIILADGMLMYYLDVTEVIKQYKDINWSLTIQLAHEWGAIDILGSVLRTCKKYFDAPISDDVISALSITGPWSVTKNLMGRVAEQELATYEERPVSGFWKLILASNGAFILRPVRLLETASYFLPPAEFLQRKYGESSLLCRIGHLFIAIKQTLRFGWDTVYFGMERYLRLKRLGKSASLFNKLEIDL